MSEQSRKENILNQLAEHARERTRAASKEISIEEMKEKAKARARLDRMGGKEDFRFEKALKKPGLRMICEVKKGSPSKGIIAKDFPYLKIAKEYEASGADCISVLTEPKWFFGQNRYLTEIADHVSLPCLRKDFTIDPYMVYEAKALGAEAILLICSLLTEEQLAENMAIADELGMSALVETHDEKQIEMAVRAGARMIGVNNRNLETFVTDIQTCVRLRPYVPEGIIYVAESGIRSSEDIHEIWQSGADALLIGESLMRAPDKRLAMLKMRRAARDD
ncbi:MAG: indole-3-glycerol phosphate synthase TrpC [Eubacterium sp.]|nr:indole-3-glycerol phosphate synthase TrpC [Eubacterium sp.]MBP3217370.1 indole-3-glycerol phosphate synthase TrpC [Lachnospiraceae bacterium]